MKIYISLWKICVRGQTTPQKKPKFSQDPSECFVNFFEGELRQRFSYTGSFRQCSLPLFISRRTFLFFVDFVIYFSNIYTAFQVSMLISNKKSSKHENLNVTLFAARLHYDTFQSERHLKDLLTRHWSLKQRATKLKIKLNSFDGTKMSIQKLRWHWTGFFSKLWQTNTLLVSKVGIFLLVHIENETFIIDEIDFFFQTISWRFPLPLWSTLTHHVVWSSG